MPRSLTIATILDAKIRVHFSWPIAAVFITALFALAILPDRNPDWSALQLWLTGALIALTLAASVLVHELAHVAIARRLGIRATTITLFALGGVAHIDEVTNRPWTELLVAIAGPTASIVIGLGALALVTALDEPTYSRTTEYFYMADGLQAHAHFYLPQETAPSQTLQYVRYIAIANLIIGAFNLLPLFPLDGGRILSAALWKITGNRNRAARTASLVGQLGAAAIILYGTYNLFFGSALSALWLIAIGVFLMEAAITSAPHPRKTPP